MFKRNKKKNLAILISSIMCMSAIGFSGVSAMEGGIINNPNNQNRINVIPQNVPQVDANLNQILTTDFRNLRQATRYFEAMKNVITEERDIVVNLAGALEDAQRNGQPTDTNVVEEEISNLSKILTKYYLDKYAAIVMKRNSDGNRSGANIRRADALLDTIEQCDILITEICDTINDKSKYFFGPSDLNDTTDHINTIKNMKAFNKLYILDVRKTCAEEIVERVSNVITAAFQPEMFKIPEFDKRVQAMNDCCHDLLDEAKFILYENRNK